MRDKEKIYANNSRLMQIIKLTVISAISIVIFVLKLKLDIKIDVIYIGLFLGVLSWVLSDDHRIFKRIGNMELYGIINVAIYFILCRIL